MVEQWRRFGTHIVILLNAFALSNLKLFDPWDMKNATILNMHTAQTNGRNS